MIKSILGGKSKNLFDISKFIDTNSVKRIGNTLVCSSYGTSIGTLESLCPTLKASDTITISFKCTSEGVASKFMSISNTSGGLKIFRSGETFPVSEVGLSSTWYLYSTDYAHSGIPNKTTYSDIQVELGSTATEYVPHELTSYKSIMKVSDVCQLANSKLFTPMNGDTVILGGVSITKNIEAGTITFNGTSTNNFWYHVHDYASELRYTNLIKGYKYYISGMPVNDLSVVFQLQSLFNLQGEQIFTAPVTSNGIGPFDIYVRKGVTLTDFVVTPQLFDLTEMFGAGNEPKTVAEFKAKFPNDYYPYSPSCFVTSFDERMPCKTKNLINSQQIYQISQHMNVTIWQGEINYVCTFSYELSKLEPNTGMAALFEFAYSDGTYSYIVSRDKYRVLSQITDSKKLTKISLINWSDIKGIISNIQLEKGTTATDYVPYGYV